MPPLTKDEVLEKLEKGESFEGVEIGEVDFSEHVFEKAVYFNGAKFLGKANFRRAQFCGEAYFWSAQFSAGAKFNGAQFSGLANFWEAQFSVKADFRLTQFTNRVIFARDKDKKIFAKDHPTLFSFVFFEKPAKVIFKRTNLNKCSFIDTDISKIDFTDVEWGIKKGFLSNRKVIYDEQTVSKEYKLVEKVYRQLKKNYEDRGSYGEAGDFHYGEMEMRRLSQKGIFKYISLTSFYKILSGYGEKHWLALFWLGFFVILFSSAYLISGLKSDVANINYDLLLNFNIFFKPSFWQDYLKALIHSLEVATFQRHRAFEAIFLTGSFFEIMQTIIIPIQVALAVLAIRRRFRR